MFQNCVSFQKATEMFYSMQYEQGLLVINDCITKDASNSILYSNRALFYSQLGYVQEALSDLNFAIQLNHLNYIAYFNMFSLLMRIENFDEAFQNLCCSLSCLYLIRAKTKKSQLDASKAIKYAENNMEAHVLKGLIHLQNGKYKLALNQLEWACEINPKHQIVRNIRAMIFKKMNPGLQIDENQLEQDQNNPKHDFLRLQSSYQFEENDKEKQLRDKIMQFNEIYNNLNEFQGTITTKVPKDDQSSTLNPTNLNQKQDSSNQFTKQQLNFENQSQYQQQADTKGPEQTNTYNETLIDDSINPDQSYQPSIPEESEKTPTYPRLTDEQLILQTHEHPIESIAPALRQSSHSNSSSQAIIADDGLATPSIPSLAPEPGQYANSDENLYLYDAENLSQNSKSFHSINQKQSEREKDNFSDFESMIHSHNSGNMKKTHDKKEFEEDFESMISENNHNESQEMSMISNALYPKPNSALLQFSILKLELLNMSKEQIAELKNLYCIANYLNIKEGASHSNFKLRTACQKGFGNGTEWNQTFDPIEIPESPECMKIKVYNKKYSSYRDDLIGEMEVEITTHGLVKLPLFNKKGELSGSLFMNLELVFREIQEADEQDQV